MTSYWSAKEITDYAKKLVDRHFATQVEAAEHFDVSQPALSQAINFDPDREYPLRQMALCKRIVEEFGDFEVGDKQYVWEVKPKSSNAKPESV